MNEAMIPLALLAESALPNVVDAEVHEAHVIDPKRALVTIPVSLEDLVRSMMKDPPVGTSEVDEWRHGEVYFQGLKE
ncbi:hypothetical protein AMTR_s00150p00053010 [Amborella trichopoda]|uniref:Uncharacterized protein n=1 Tax=Amborella trichopoda TaxID=13333 RepID=W1PL94_AMBTC|nr:hypothetical protein AMTR_s00150p00053010 [Amborella trichopoda]